MPSQALERKQFQFETICRKQCAIHSVAFRLQFYSERHILPHEQFILQKKKKITSTNSSGMKKTEMNPTHNYDRTLVHRNMNMIVNVLHEDKRLNLAHNLKHAKNILHYIILHSF